MGLDIADLVMEIEDVFDIDMIPDTAPPMPTVGDTYQFILSAIFARGMARTRKCVSPVGLRSIVWQTG